MPVDILVVALGAFFAALAIGSAGFAFSMVATGFWIYVLPPQFIVLMASVCGTLLHGMSVWRYRKSIDIRRLAPFVVGGFIGVPLGVWALSHIDLVTFRHLVGILMIVYGAYALLGLPLRTVAGRPTMLRAADVVVGWAGGVLGGVAMLNGVLPTIWCNLRGWDKNAARQIYQPYIWCTGLLVMALTGLKIGNDAGRLPFYMMVALPGALVGWRLGHRLFDWVSEPQFRRLLSVLILASGLALQF